METAPAMIGSDGMSRAATIRQIAMPATIRRARCGLLNSEVRAATNEQTKETSWFFMGFSLWFRRCPDTSVALQTDFIERSTRNWLIAWLNARRWKQRQR